MLHMKEGKQNKGRHLYNVINYVLNEEKTQYGTLTTGINCIPAIAYEHMMLTKKRFEKQEGRQGYHFIISFKPGECDAQLAYKISQEFAQKFLDNKYEVVVATHDDKEHIHSHLVFNSVALDGKKYHYSNGQWAKTIQPIINELAKEYGLSIIDNLTMGNDTPYNLWQAQKQGKITWADIVKLDIDNIIDECYSLEQLLNELEYRGYEIKNDGKYLAFKPYGKEKFIRAISIGEEYTRAGLNKRLDYIESSPLKKRKRYDMSKFKRQRPKVKLSKFQAHYFRYMHMLGKIKKKPKYNQKTYKYRKDVFKFEQIQKQFNYLQAYKINTIYELDEKIETLIKQDDLLTTRRVAIYREIKKNNKMFDMVKEYKSLKVESDMYLAGDEIFKQGHLRRLELEKQILKIDSIENIISKEQYFKSGLEEISHEKRQIKEELIMCKNIKEQSIKQQEKEEKQEQTKNKKQTRKKERGFRL